MATCGVNWPTNGRPGCRFAHPGYACLFRSDGAAHRTVVQHQLVSAHVDKELSVIASALLVELRRNHDAQTRGLDLVHGDKRQISIPETELGRFGRIVKIDLRQVSRPCRNVERQNSS